MKVSLTNLQIPARGLILYARYGLDQHAIGLFSQLPVVFIRFHYDTTDIDVEITGADQSKIRNAALLLFK
jgi:hypothetical protein